MDLLSQYNIMRHKAFKYDCLMKKLEEDNEKDKKTIQYYEQAYRDSKSEHDKKSYKRIIDIANARRELRKEILKEREEK